MLLQVSRIYAGHHGIDLRTVSSRVFDDGKVLPRLSEGSASVTLARADRAVEWFSTNWPEGAAWPADVSRPALAEPALAESEAGHG